MLIKTIAYCFFCICAGSAVSAGFVAFITMLGIFDKLAEQMKSGKGVHRIDHRRCHAWKCCVSVRTPDSDRAGRIQHLQSVWRHFYRVSRRCFSRNLTGHANSIPPFGRADMAPLCDCRGCHRKSTRLRLADSVFPFLNYSERSYLYESKAKRPGI